MCGPKQQSPNDIEKGSRRYRKRIHQREERKHKKNDIEAKRALAGKQESCGPGSLLVIISF